jgi:two-component system chemotaxis response regulator CheB
MKDAGAHTLAQDEATSAVFGMPKAAIELGCVDRVLALEDIPRALAELTR